MTYQEILQYALTQGITEVEIFATQSEGLQISLDDGLLRDSSATQQLSVSIRGLYNGKMGQVSLESVDQVSIEKAIANLIANANLITTDDKQIIYGEKHQYQEVEVIDADYNNYTQAQKIAKLQEIDQRILARDPRVTKVSHLVYRENASKTNLINSKGIDLEKSFSYIMVYAGAIAKDGDETGNAYYGDIDFKFENLDFDKIVNVSVDDALAKLGAGNIATGQYPVILKYEVVNSLFGAFSSIFSGQAAMKKMTILTDKAGQKVFGDNITIYDDPYDPRSLVKSAFDDEGVPCYTKKIVENGVFNGLLHNLATADFFKTTSTGNGVRGGNVAAANMWLAPGDKSVEEMAKTINHGVYVTEVSGLHAGVNPISGDFNVQASGFEIVDGKIGRPITLFVVSGNFYEILNNVDEIGNDLEPKYTGINTPSLKIKSMNISGK